MRQRMQEVVALIQILLSITDFILTTQSVLLRSDPRCCTKVYEQEVFSGDEPSSKWPACFRFWNNKKYYAAMLMVFLI